MHRFSQLWGHRDFRWLFISQTISTTGDRIVLVALALLVTERTGSTADLGLVLGVYTASTSPSCCSAASGPIASRAIGSCSRPTCCAACCTRWSRC